jgi:hypothetical protein
MTVFAERSVYRCCLCGCDANGKVRAGQIRDGYGVPTCAEHFAAGYWASRQPRPPCVVTAAVQEYLDLVGRAALAQAIAG